MRGNVLIALCSLFVGAAGMFLLMSDSLAVVNADCPNCPGEPCGNGDVNGDGKLDISDAVYLLSYLFAQGSEPCCLPCPPCRLPATGQAACSDIDGNEIACDSPEYSGQDGLFQAGCPMQGRFVDNGDGTVTDTCTDLMWQQEAAPGRYTWEEALQYCQGLTLGLGDYDDWRLPNVRELQSIVDYGRSGLVIDPVFIVEPSPKPWYWSSSSGIGLPVHAWIVAFNGGGVGGDTKVNYNYVRAVRGGL